MDWLEILHGPSLAQVINFEIFCSLAAHLSSPAGKYHLTGLIVDIYGFQVTNPKAAVIVSK